MPYCSALDNHCCIKVDNTFSPCCRYIDQKESFDPNQVSFIEFKNSKFYKELKERMVSGWDDGCRVCQLEESLGKVSLRHKHNTLLSADQEKLEYLELSVSNQCNLTCKMCSNPWSSKWESLVKQNEDLLKFHFSNTKSLKIDFQKVFENLDLSNLKLVKYLGGEPFITPELVDLIEFLEKNNNLQQITLKVNTNGTFFPRKLLKYLIRFKSVHLSISVDGVEDLCNFIRTGEEWKKVNSVIQKWIQFSKFFPKIKLKIHTTLQAYNIHQIGEIKKYSQEHNIEHFYSIITSPSYLTLSSVPKEYLENLKIEDTFIQKIISDIKFDQHNFERLKDYTNTVDKILKTSIKETIPELYKYF